MDKLLFLIILIFSLIGCMPELQRPSPKSEEDYQIPLPSAEINSDQPIPIGEIIFKEEIEQSYFITGTFIIRKIVVTYTYLGLDDKNNVKVLYKYKFITEQEEKVDTLLLLLPLNAKKQTMLFVKSKLRGGINRDLLITVVDEFSRITVEEIRKTQPK